MTDQTVSIEGVTVNASIVKSGAPVVIVIPDRKSQTIHVNASGFDRRALCALLSVVEATLEGAEDDD